jgi:hypothetical protein
MRIRVHLGDDCVGGFGVKLPSRRPLRFELLAMSAPRRVEFDENVFAAVDNRIKVLGGEHDNFGSGQ